MTKVMTRELSCNEIEEMFPGAHTHYSDVGCEMIVWAGPLGHESGLDYVFLNKLPLLYDGSFYNPTVGATIDLDYLRKLTDLTGSRLPEGHTVRIVFGEYDEERKEFMIAVREPQDALVEIECDPMVVRLTEENFGGARSKFDPQSIRYERYLLDDYGRKGRVYLVIRLETTVMKLLAKEQDKKIAKVLADSAEILEQFEAEKDEWKAKIRELLPESWRKDTPTRKVVFGTDDLELMWELSPGHWKTFLQVRFDEVGYEKAKAKFTE